MEENRKVVFYLEAVGNAGVLERSIARINGVLSVNVIEEKSMLEYTIDEWASDYDVFTEVMRICAECGASIDFDRKDEEPAEGEEKAQEENLPQEKEEVEEEQEESAPSKKKKKGGLSERVQRVIELGVAITAYVVALFFTDMTQYIFLAIAFAIAGYDALYEAFAKILKKQFISEELVITLAFFASILLGYTSFAVIALLLYSVVSFARKIIREEIEKNSAFAKQEQKLTVVDGDGVKNVSYSKVEVGNSVLLSSGTVSAFDGVLENDCIVEDFKGEKREAKLGEEIYAGEKILGEAQIKVTAIGEECKFGKFNKYVSEAFKSTSPLAEKIQKNLQIIELCIFAFALLIAFIPPIFYQSYKTALLDWGYRAVIFATVSGMSFYLFSSEINMLSALALGRKRKLGFSGYKAIDSLAKANKLFLDYEGALVDENGLLKEDAQGAVREIKDSGLKDISIACSLDDDSALDLCKKLNVGEYYSRDSESEKQGVIKQNLVEGVAVATTASVSEKVKSGNGAVVCFNCEKQGYLGDACLASDEIAYLPYAIKLAKRTVKIQKINLILGVSVKAVITVLALLGFAQLWWAVLADSLVSVICAFNAYVNSKEVY